jgi:hypothetical protein
LALLAHAPAGARLLPCCCPSSPACWRVSCKEGTQAATDSHLSTHPCRDRVQEQQELRASKPSTSRAPASTSRWL